MYGSLKIKKFILISFIALSILTCICNTSFASTQLHNLKLQQFSVEHGLWQGTIKSIMQDNSGLIWIATESGINIYDGYQFKKLRAPSGDFGNFRANALMQDKNGLVWINFIQ